MKAEQGNKTDCTTIVELIKSLARRHVCSYIFDTTADVYKH